MSSYDEPGTANSPNVVYSSLTTHDTIRGSSSQLHLVTENPLEPYTGLYVMSILASIFCTWCPCGFIGLMHVIAARADYSRGSFNLSQKKRGQALCWTGWACGLGLVAFILIIVGLALGGAAIIKVIQQAESGDSHPEIVTYDPFG